MQEHLHVGPFQFNIPPLTDRTFQITWGGWHWHWGKLTGGGRYLQTPWFGIVVLWNQPK